MKGWRNRAPAPRQADALTADALTRVREILRIPRRGRGGRLESAETAQHLADLDLAIIGVLADGGLRRSEAAVITRADVELWPDGTGRITVQKVKNQVQPETVAVTMATARALRDIQPNDADPAAQVFGLTGEALANRVRAAARPPAWVTDSPDTAAASASRGEWWPQGRPTPRYSARAGGSTAIWSPATRGASRQARH